MIAYLIFLSVYSLTIDSYQAQEACKLVLDKYDREAMMSRNFVFGENNLWPNKKVPYIFETTFNPSEKTKIRQAMDKIEASSCVKFVPLSGEQNYIGIRHDLGGCSANGLGYIRDRRNITVNLDRRGCMSESTIIHELLHTLGFMHEQNRPDRDLYVRVNWDNIKAFGGYYYQFARARSSSENMPVCNMMSVSPHSNCYNGKTATTFDLPYDYQSVMHYSRNGFSKNGEDTLTPLRGGGETLGNRAGMSSLDIQKLNKAYECGSDVKICRDSYRWCSYYGTKCGESYMKQNCQKTCNSC